MTRRRILPWLVLPNAVILFVCAVFPAVAQAQSISVGSASGTPGSTVSFAVNFTPGTTGVSALSFDLTYPATLTFVPPPPDITGSAALAAGKSTSANFHNGVLTILVFGLNQNTIGAGAIAQLPFSISGSAVPGTPPITISNASGTDANANPVAVSTTSGSVTVNAGADTTPPTISGVSTSNVTGTSATVTWTTSEAADSQVEYGTTTGYGSATAVNSPMVIPHSVGLSGLEPSTTYHYRVMSKDAAGNAAVSTDYTFTTSLSDTTPPTISRVSSASVTVTGATIAWVTNEQSTSQVEYGTTTGYGSTTALYSSMTTSHSVIISGLASNTLYHYRVKSADSSGNVGISGDYSFSTPASGNEPIDVQLTLTYPRSLTSGPGGPGSPDEEFIGVALVNLGTRPATLRFTACDFAGREITGASITNRVRRTLNPGEQLPILDAQLFGSGFTGANNGSVKIESDVQELAGFFMVFDAGLSVLDGTTVSPASLDHFVFPEIDTAGYTQIQLANPGDAPATVTLELVALDGTVKARGSLAIPGHGAASSQLFRDVFQGVAPAATHYVRGVSDQPVVPMEMFGRTVTYIDGLNGQDSTSGSTTLYSPQYAYGGPWSSRLSVVNLDATPGFVTLRLIGENGAQLGASKVLPIGGYGKIYIDNTGFFGGSTPDGGTQVTQGYVEVAGNGIRLAGDVVFGDAARSRFSSALPLVSTLANSLLFGHVASSDLYFTGISIVNPNPSDTAVTIDLYTDEGVLDASVDRLIPARQRLTGVLTQLFPQLAGQNRTSGYIRIRADKGVASFALFGTHSLSALSAIPAQVK